MLQQIVDKFCAGVYNEQYFKFYCFNEQSINVKRNSKGIGWFYQFFAKFLLLCGLVLVNFEDDLRFFKLS
jgi:hypothetical protein